VGEAGPELVRFKGGETVLPNSVSTGYAGGAGFEPVQQINVYLDGRQVYSAMQQRAVGTQKRTGHNGMQRRTR
jgi:phage-related tail protein